MNNFENVIKETVNNSIDTFDLSLMNPEDTVVVVVDMINGFINEGPLASPRVKEIVPNVANMMNLANKNKIQVVSFVDTHEPDSVEFKSYPPHCIKGTSEAEMVDELKEIGTYTLIEKGSTNGFIEPKFQEWLSKHHHIKNYIVTGCCTDICVEGFVMTLNQYANANHKDIQIIVPVSCVETYDAPNHDANFMNNVSLYKFMCNGIKLVK